MSDLKVIEFQQSGETPRDVLARALDLADRYDEVIVIAQNKTVEGGLVWFARDFTRLETVLYLLESAVFKFRCMAAGFKV